MTEQVLGGYVLHEVVGWGAVGQVYRGARRMGEDLRLEARPVEEAR